MILSQVPAEGYFTFIGFPKDVCKVLEKNGRAVKVEELTERSWYSETRVVEYPLPQWKINLYENEKNIF